ncbi:SDR family oxidoreductase [Salisaeta longa]|uniref:SDR family oxidoreductase n=1 Tax=Salisaeta longa TaxID=503170 RepID=UPI0003B6C2E8|nr:SDR family oxidoreductase [Salisaeta longa]
MPASFATALITGANRGVGYALVHALAPHVDHLFAACRSPESAHDLQAAVASLPATIDLLPLDVTDPAQIDAARATVAATVDGLDLLINNAGVDGGASDDGFGDVTFERMTHTLQVNTVGPHLMAQAFADLLRRAPHPPARLLNITSQLGSIANTSGGTWQSYKVSKAGLNMCTRLQAGAFDADAVIVASVHPGWVQTDMGGPNAHLTPEASAQGIVAVAQALTPDDSGRFLTHDGETLPW